jgi:hypothetical protein
MGGSGENPRGVVGLHRLPVIHHHGAVRDLGNYSHVVRDEEDRHILFLLQNLEEVQDLRLDRDVERGCRLVGDQ